MGINSLELEPKKFFYFAGTSPRNRWFNGKRALNYHFIDLKRPQTHKYWYKKHTTSEEVIKHLSTEADILWFLEAEKMCVINIPYKEIKNFYKRLEDTKSDVEKKLAVIDFFELNVPCADELRTLQSEEKDKSLSYK